jgi:hypothetical protein
MSRIFYGGSNVHSYQIDRSLYIRKTTVQRSLWLLQRRTAQLRLAALHSDRRKDLKTLPHQAVHVADGLTPGTSRAYLLEYVAD